jgi:hypothetical protein
MENLNILNILSCLGKSIEFVGIRGFEAISIAVEYCHGDRNVFDDGTMKMHILFYYFFQISNQLFQVSIIN